MAKPRAAFTLVEILIVVVILAILAAIVVPQMVGAQSESQVNATLYDLGKVRRHLVVYHARNDEYPAITAGDGTWGEIVGDTTNYLMSAPVNSWVGGDNRRALILRDSPDTAYQSDHGWIFDPNTGSVWAGGFSGEDVPFDRTP
ncbi:MAG: prepilin-type N-terminal cleavage/methylation domain-containing protein [Phycisphaerales bacterium]|jgi:general secretion pathway protein G